MKIGVVSDSHGNMKSLKNAIKAMGDVDYLVHCGDYTSDFETIEKELSYGSTAVKGNCDLLSDRFDETVISLSGKKIFITHGDKYQVKWGFNRLFYRALELEVDIVLFGHTHQPIIFREENILFVNPGSTNQPRGVLDRSCAIVEISEFETNANLVEI